MDNRLLPDFFIIGAAKAGSTALYEYLIQHPSVYMPEIKETNFFYSDEKWGKGVDWYLRTFFAHSESFLARGEASPGYLYLGDKVAPRIRAVYGDNPPKFVVLLRDPVERAWSHYLHMRRIHEEQEEFERALELEEGRLKEHPDLWVGYFRDGQYARCLKKWFLFFEQSRFHYILSSELNSNPIPVLHHLCDFLGLPKENYYPEKLVSNEARVPRSQWLMKWLAEPGMLKSWAGILIPHHLKMKLVRSLREMNLKKDSRPQLPSEISERLRQRFLSDICELETITNLDLSSWKPH